MKLQQQLSIAIVLSAGVGFSGCQSSMGGLAFWNKNQDRSIAHAAPDVNRQQYDGLSKEFASSGRSGSALGGPKPAAPTGISGMWQKSTASVAGVFAAKPKIDTQPDATRLDSPSRKVGPEVYVAAARLMENQSKFPEAEQQYEKALKASPNDLNALVGLARLHDRQGQSVKAVQFYERAVKSHGKDALVYNDLGLYYARQKQLDKSIPYLAKAVDLQPDNARYRNNLATVLVESGRTGEALAQLSRANSEAVAHYNVGFLLHKRGQQNEAVQHLQQAIALDPDMTPAREMLAQWSMGPDSGMAQQADPRLADRPMYNAGSSYRTGVPSMPVSIEMPAADPEAPSGQYRISDEGNANSAQASISDGPALRLPPLEE